MSWFQIWTVCWQVMVFITPLVLGCVVLWMKTQFVTKVEARSETNRINGAIDLLRSEAKAEANRVDAALNTAAQERDRRWEKVRDQLGDHAGRITAAEDDLKSPPTRHALNNEITRVLASVEGLKGEMGGLRDQARTTNEYLHALLDDRLGK